MLDYKYQQLQQIQDKDSKMGASSGGNGGGGGGSSSSSSSRKKKTYTDTSSLAGLARASGGSTAKKINAAARDRKDTTPKPKTASVGYGVGQVDPRLAKAAGIKDSGMKPVLDGKGGIVKDGKGNPVTSRARPVATNNDSGSDNNTSTTSTKTTSAPATVSSTAAGRQQREDTKLNLATDNTGSRRLRRKRQGKRALVLQRPTAQVGGSGASGLNIPKG